jgi:hypothetical protein
MYVAFDIVLEVAIGYWTRKRHSTIHCLDSVAASSQAASALGREPWKNI